MDVRLSPDNRRFLFKVACIWIAAMSFLWVAVELLHREPGRPPTWAIVPLETTHRTAEAPSRSIESAPAEALQPADGTVYVTKTGRKYHRESCPHLRSRIPMPLSEAAAAYAPCSVCNPPVP